MAGLAEVGLGRRGEWRQVPVRIVLAGMDGVFSRGIGAEWQARRGMARQGVFRHGRRGRCGRAVLGFGEVGRGRRGTSRLGQSRVGAVCRGTAGEAKLVLLSNGRAGQAW